MPDKVPTNGWGRHRFDQMATMVNDRIDDPSGAHVEYYVGLEHLDSDSLAIRRWGSPADVEATKLRFRTGDIIFGRRRVYQRKLAVAHFDGICSAHAMVLRAKAEVALPEFLPFFMKGDLFMSRAKEISVGSLSPTINWKTLAKEEFALPPLQEQRRLAEVLRAAEAATDSLMIALERAKRVQQALMSRHFAPGAGIAAGYRPLEELTIRVNDGTHQPPAFTTSGVPFLLVSNVAGGRINWEVEKYVSFDVFKQLSRTWRPQLGDVLYSLVGSYGVPAIVDRDTPFTFQRHIGLIRTDASKLLPRFLYWYLRSPIGLQQAHLRAEGLAQKTITLGALRGFRVPAPALDSQRATVLEIDASQDAVEAVEVRTRGLKGMASRLMASGFAEGS